MELTVLPTRMRRIAEMHILIPNKTAGSIALKHMYSSSSKLLTWNCLAMCRNQMERIRTPQDALSRFGDPCGCFFQAAGRWKPGENDDPLRVEERHGKTIWRFNGDPCLDEVVLGKLEKEKNRFGDWWYNYKLIPSRLKGTSQIRRRKIESLANIRRKHGIPGWPYKQIQALMPRSRH